MKNSEQVNPLIHETTIILKILVLLVIGGIFQKFKIILKTPKIKELLLIALIISIQIYLITINLGLAIQSYI